MPKFEFHLDKKCTIWVREFHFIDAETLEDAQCIIARNFNNPYEIEDSFSEQELIYESLEDMTFKENGNQPTQELWCSHSNKLIIDNDFKKLSK